MKTEREIFEDWFKKKYPSTSIEKQIDMEYWHERTEMSWQSWLASKNREGYRLVPEYHVINIKDALVLACDIREDESRFEDSLNYVHKNKIGILNEH